MDAYEILRDADMHGKIMVTVQRGNLIARTEYSGPGASRLHDGNVAPNTKISSKEVIKDNRVSHAVR